MIQPSEHETAVEFLRQATAASFPGHIGIEIVEIGDGWSRLRCEIRPHHLAPNGFLHAGSVVTLADTAAGYGCFVNRPETSDGFTTIELKSNFTGTLFYLRLESLARPRLSRKVGFMTDTYGFIKGLRAIRDYRDEPLSNEDLGAILEAGRWTGSSKNRQDWSFIAVTDSERLQNLAEHGDFTQPVRDSVATIVLVQEPGGYEFDIGRAAQNMMLAAKSIGVASCPITLHRDRAAAALLGVPDEATCRYAIALGYPSDDAAPRNFGGRKTADQVIKLDSYD